MKEVGFFSVAAAHVKISCSSDFNACVLILIPFLHLRRVQDIPAPSLFRWD